MKIYVGCDHAGYEYRKMICEYLKGLDYNVIECENLEYNTQDDYNDAACDVIERIENDRANNIDSKGILICGTGIGMSIAANRHKMIRAAVCRTEYEARLTRLHNDANILCLGSRVTGSEIAKDIARCFLETSFSNEDVHKSRIERLG